MTKLILLCSIVLLALPVLARADTSPQATAEADPPPLMIDARSRAADLAYSPDGQTLAVVSSSLALWDAVTGASRRQIALPTPATRVAFLSNDRVLTASEQAVSAWDVSSGSAAGTIRIPGKIADMDLSADRSLLAVATDQGIYLVHPDASLAGNVQPRLIGAAGKAWGTVALSPDAKTIAVGGPIEFFSSEAFGFYTWDVATGQPGKINQPVGFALDLAFSADGRRLAAAGGSTTVWDVATGNEVEFSIENLPESGVSFAGNRLLSAQFFFGAPGATAVRDVTTGETLALLQRELPKPGNSGGDSFPFVPIAASPDGSHFATPDQQGAILIWPVPAESKPAINVIAYCDNLKRPPTGLTSSDPVNLVWSWYATEPTLIFEHVGTAQYEVTLDGRPLSAIAATRSFVRRDPVNHNEWTIYYTMKLGALAAGQHIVTYRLTWRSAINDGHNSFGPGTLNPDNTGTCTFTVQ